MVGEQIPKHQVRYLQNKKGILITLDAPGKTSGVSCFQIDWQHFYDWFCVAH